MVVRLNKKYYDARRFTSQGIAHEEMYFTDGSNPTDDILERFIARCEETPGAIAVHCKAGLGRTGCVIGGYIMKHYQFTAEELIGWLRIVRPGSIIGPQQQYMQDIQMRMWQDGEVYRANIASMSAPRTKGECDPTLPGIAKNGKGKSIQASPIITSHKTAGTGVNALTDKMRSATVSSAQSNSPPPIASGSSAAQQSNRPNCKSGERTPTIGVSPPGANGSSSPSFSLFPKEKDSITQGDELLRRRNEMKAEHVAPLEHQHSPVNSADNSSADMSSSSINTLGTTSSAGQSASGISRVGKMISSTFSAKGATK